MRNVGDALIISYIQQIFSQFQDMWRNKEHFPRSFPQGPAEGFWWAYVSMTTVG